MRFARTSALVNLLRKQIEILQREGLTLEATALREEVRHLGLLAELNRQSPPPNPSSSVKINSNGLESRTT
jgi:hypothetical protein